MAKSRTEAIRIGITGSNLYENQIKIKDHIFTLSPKLHFIGCIVSLGNDQGCDKYVRKYSLEFNVAYKEVLATHTPSTLYSLTNTDFVKPYAWKNVAIQMAQYAKYIDKLHLFWYEKETYTPGTRILRKERRCSNYTSPFCSNCPHVCTYCCRHGGYELQEICEL